MALVRVYCGLASADETVRSASAAQLTIAVVDDAGRLLGVHEISDDPGGYAELGALLVERTSGFTDAAVAADSDDHLVTSLLTAAGRPLAVADDDSTDDFAERFADDDSVDEMQAPPAARRAVGLARALQAGALAAVNLPAPRELVSYKPILAAHVALLNGRHGAAVALREVLRELYPAALRAYPDPAHPLALAVLDALPEPSRLAVPGLESQRVAEQVVTELARGQAGTEDEVISAVTALSVAISESPRRGGVNKSLAPFAAKAIRQAIAAVRSCDAACDELIGTIAERSTPAGVGRRSARRAAEPAPLQAVPTGDTSRFGRRSRPEPAATGSGPAMPRPLTTPPVAPEPIMPPPLAPRPVTPPPAVPAAAAVFPNRAPAPGNRPVSVPPPPPGMTPITPGSRPVSGARSPLAPTSAPAASFGSASSTRPPLPTRSSTRSSLPQSSTQPPSFSSSPSSYSSPGMPSRPSSGMPASGMPSSPLSSSPLSQSHLSQSHLSQSHLSQSHLSQSPLSQSPLSQSPLSQSPLSQSPLSQSPLSQSPSSLSSSPLSPSSPAPSSLPPASVSPADNGQPFQATLTNAAINSARAERQRTVIPTRPTTTRAPSSPAAPNSATDYSLPMPTQRPGETAEPGSRANWPLLNPGDEALPPTSPIGGSPLDSRLHSDGRVKPPWQDMPKEPPALRLVEPQLADSLDATVTDLPAITDPPSLRLIDRDDRGFRNGRLARRSPGSSNSSLNGSGLNGSGMGGSGMGGSGMSGSGMSGSGMGSSSMSGSGLNGSGMGSSSMSGSGMGGSGMGGSGLNGSGMGSSSMMSSSSTTLTALDRSTTPPVPAEGNDGDLLIFAAARSAWFTGHSEASTDLDWTNPNDTGWRAAEKAATPAVAAETSAGLPKRVPQANLVPGSPLRDERPLRIVRDAASIAAHTTGYFRGWRRGQEIGGFAMGGRPGREAAGGWDFTRDGQATDDYRNDADYRTN